MAEEKKYVVIDKSYLDSLLDKLHDITGENNPPKSFPAQELWDECRCQFSYGKHLYGDVVEHGIENKYETLSDFLTTKSL